MGQEINKSEETFRWFEPLERHEKLLMAVFPTIFVASVIRSFFVPEYSAFTDLWWVFSFSIAMAGPAFVKARRSVLGQILRKMPQKSPVFQEMYEDFIQKAENGRTPWVAGIIAGLFFLSLRIGVSWNIPAILNSSLFWFNSTVFAVGFTFFIKTLWLFISFGYLINRMGIELEKLKDQNFSLEAIEMAGKGYARTSLGAAVLSICLFWMIFTHFRFFVSDIHSISLQVLAMEAVFAIAILFPVMYFILPQWRLHRILTKRKEEIRSLFYSEFLETERNFLLNPQKDLAQKYLLERQLIKEIDNLPEWPFKFDTLAPILSMVAIPVTLFIFKEIIVEVFVQLLKK